MWKCKEWCYLLVNRKEICKFKASDENVNFFNSICVGSISNKVGATDSKDVSLKGNVYDLSINYNSIDKSDILDIQKYLMVKNSI